MKINLNLVIITLFLLQATTETLGLRKIYILNVFDQPDNVIGYRGYKYRVEEYAPIKITVNTTNILCKDSIKNIVIPSSSRKRVFFYLHDMLEWNKKYELYYIETNCPFSDCIKSVSITFSNGQTLTQKAPPNLCGDVIIYGRSGMIIEAMNSPQRLSNFLTMGIKSNDYELVNLDRTYTPYWGEKPPKPIWWDERTGDGQYPPEKDKIMREEYNKAQKAAK